MTAARAVAPRRRAPPPADRYRAVARATKQRRARSRLSPLATGIVWGIVLGSAALIADTAAVGIGHAASSLGGVVNVFVPAPVPVGDLIVNDTTGQVGAAPLLDATPQFTKNAALVVQGLIPSFGGAADRKVSIALNGGLAVLVPIDANGHFALPITLANGTNQLVVALVTPEIEAIASTTVSVVLDTVAPPLVLTKPTNGDSIAGLNLTVEGKAEPGATVLVNDRNAIVGQDGSFSETITVAAGTVPLTVIARDRAGNETKSQLSVTMNAAKASPGATASAVAVALANATVKPGALVTANISVVSGASPVQGIAATLQIGALSFGSALTNAAGKATISFFAPLTEGTVQIDVHAGPATGNATLTVAK